MGPWWAPVFSFIWQNGGSLFSEDLSVTTIDSQETIEALQWISDLFVTHRVAPSPADYGLMGSNEVDYFAQGRGAMMIGHGRWMTQFFHDTVTNFEWEIAALPGQKTHATFFHLNTYQINASTPNKNEAWDFFKFLVSEEGQQIHARYGQGVPNTHFLAMLMFVSDYRLAGST